MRLHRFEFFQTFLDQCKCLDRLWILPLPELPSALPQQKSDRVPDEGICERFRHARASTLCATWYHVRRKKIVFQLAHAAVRASTVHACFITDSTRMCATQTLPVLDFKAYCYFEKDFSLNFIKIAFVWKFPNAFLGSAPMFHTEITSCALI